MISKNNNIILSDLSMEQLELFLKRVNVTPLKFRKSLDLPEYISFGNEIEINGIDFNTAEIIVGLFNDVHDLYDKDRFNLHEEETAAAEIVTPILTNQPWDWVHLAEMFATLKDTGATIAGNTSSHLHIGTHRINTPQKLSLLLKTLVVFEPIIFKFGYGITNEPRDFLTAKENFSIFSPMMTPKRVRNFTDALDSYNYNSQGIMRSKFIDFLAPDLRFRPVFNFKDFDFSKLHYGITMENPQDDDHFEVRCFNGTLQPEIVQNNINLITHIMIAVIEGRIDEEYVLAEYEKYKKKRYNFDVFCAILHDTAKIDQYNRLLDGYNKVKIDKALKLADMIFSNELDKIYFLKQYLKLFDVDNEIVCGIAKKKKL
ncbi:MAG TPA: amidoligase family protein [Candidatus Coprovivens excrementavium]|nr:amidoligase family protein [Candidatus Coprovivens excrementavium]